MLPLPHLKTNPWLNLNFVEVFITSLSSSINSQVQALEVWRIHLKVMDKYIKKPLIHSNILWCNLYSLINVSSSSKRLSPPHLIWVTVIVTSVFDVCATITDQGTGGREGSVRFLDASYITSELKIEQNLFVAYQHNNSE